MLLSDRRPPRFDDLGPAVTPYNTIAELSCSSAAVDVISCSKLLANGKLCCGGGTGTCCCGRRLPHVADKAGEDGPKAERREGSQTNNTAEALRRESSPTVKPRREAAVNDEKLRQIIKIPTKEAEPKLSSSASATAACRASVPPLDSSLPEARSHSSGVSSSPLQSVERPTSTSALCPPSYARGARSRSRAKSLGGATRDHSPGEEVAALRLIYLHLLKMLPDNVREQQPKMMNGSEVLSDAAIFPDALSPKKSARKSNKCLVELADDLVENEEDLPQQHHQQQQSNNGKVPAWGKVGVELYKRLFSDFLEFTACGHHLGAALVVDLLETLLKLRIRRVHSCLLRGPNLASLVTCLAFRYPSLSGVVRDVFGKSEPMHFTTSSSLKKSAVPGANLALQQLADRILSSEARELVEQIRVLDALSDALITPCDYDTYAGLIAYTDGVKELLSQKVLAPQQEFFSDAFPQRHRLIAGDDGTRGGASVLCLCAHAIRAAPHPQACEAAWTAMREVVSLVRAHGDDVTASTLLAREVRPARLVGLVCHALVLKYPNTPVSRQTACSVMADLIAECPACLRAVRECILQFSEAWPYLLHPVVVGDDSLAALAVGSLLQAILHQPGASCSTSSETETTARRADEEDAADLRRVLMAGHMDRLVHGVLTSRELSALGMVLKELVDHHDSANSGAPLANDKTMKQLNISFHCALAEACCSRLDPAVPETAFTSARHAIPLLQYLGLTLASPTSWLTRCVGDHLLRIGALNVIEFWLYSARTDLLATDDLARLHNHHQHDDPHCSHGSISDHSSSSKSSSSLLAMTLVGIGLSLIRGGRVGKGRAESKLTPRPMMRRRRPNNVLYGVAHQPYVALLRHERARK
jgi:hypothetical protein